MSDVDAVAALPGGGVFAALWRQVDGDSDAVQALSASWQKAATGLDAHLSRVNRAVGEVGAGWSGAGAQAVESFSERYAAAGRDLDRGLTTAGSVLGQAATEIDTVKRQLTAIAGRILDEADRINRTGTTPPATAASRNTLMEQAVGQGCQQASGYVQGLSSALESAASTVRGAVGGSGFLALPPPTSRTYLPEPGRPLGWTPQPRSSGGATTTPSGASSDSSGGGSDTPPGPSASSGASGSQAPAPTVRPSGDVAGWIAQATKLLEANGVSAGAINADDIAMIIQNESSGDPNAINNWDSNAAKGTPSKGLMQTIDPTFNAYALPGHGEIWNPVDNIVAGVRYALHTYGSLDNVPGVRSVHAGGRYMGY